MNRHRNTGGHRDVKDLSKNRNRFVRLDPDISSRYEDIDDDVTVTARGGNGNRGGKGARNPFDRRTASIANTGVRNAEIVYKVKIPFGVKRFGSKWIMKQLNQKIENFKPLLMSETQRGDLEFFLKDDDIAMAVRSLHRRVYHKESSCKMEALVNKVPAPWMNLKKSEIEFINKVVDKRYNAESRMLDLSDFANDSEFTSRDMLMTLTKGNVMLAIIDRIDERYGNITALSLSNNRLRHLDYAAALTYITKFVKVLDMSHNQVSSEDDFKKLSGFPVENLYFEGNPICEKMESASSYLSLVQAVFPRCAMLDGIAVTPLVSGPENQEDGIIPFRAGFYSNPQIRELVEQFVVSFYQLYDGMEGQRTRKQLVEAYDENNSTFTLTIVNLNTNEHFRYPNKDCYESYIRQSHNILTQEYFSRNRSARIARGAMDIAVALSKLPTSNHMTPTFIVDVFLVTNELLGFTVQGMFEDGILASGDQVPTPSFFSRTFTVAPREGGRVAVISDELFISSASTNRLTKYQKLLEQAANNGAAQEPVNSVSQASIGINGMGFDGEPPKDVKEQMISAFCQFSGMTVPWSEKCLSDFGWNFDAACQKFVEIKDSVPAEAFAR